MDSLFAAAAERSRRSLRTTAKRSALPLAALALLNPAHAFDIDTGSDDFKLKWDNTFKYSAAARLRNPSSTLTSAAVNADNPNLDDGDLNFNRGLISNRLDIYSELDATYRQFGFRASGAGWVDSVYNQHNDNPGTTANQVSVAPNEFSRTTRRIHGRDAELLDAFVFGKTTVGDNQLLAFRLGSHSLVWGETFFFGANGIAGGMMPVDAVKLTSVPNTAFKEAIRPVPMVSGSWQPTAETLFGAYYQFRWAPSRTPAVGSYFSVTDNLPEGAERLIVAGPNSPFLADAYRGEDARPRNSGQAGLQLRTRILQTDLGVYLIRFHDKTPQPVVGLGLAPVLFVPPPNGPGCVIPAGNPAQGGSVATGPASCAAVAPVNFRLVYPEGITSLGFSATRSIGDVNFAGEVSFRRNQPLTSALTTDASALFGAAPTDNSGNPAYPVGRTAHANLSAIWSIAPNALFNEGSLVGEIGWNRLLSVTRNAQLLDPATSRDAVAVRGVFSTVHRQVVAGLDLSPQIGLGWAPRGSRSAITTTTMPQNGNGDVTLGLDITYLDVWRASVSATHYVGSAGSLLTPTGAATSSLSFRNFYADRDFVAFSLRRGF